LDEEYIRRAAVSEEGREAIEDLARRFWAPEVATDAKYSVKSDVYAFGLYVSIYCHGLAGFSQH
jgi:hypothetical protein